MGLLEERWGRGQQSGDEGMPDRQKVENEEPRWIRTQRQNAKCTASVDVTRPQFPLLPLSVFTSHSEFLFNPFLKHTCHLATGPKRWYLQLNS